MITEIQLKCDDEVWARQLYQSKDLVKISINGVEVEAAPIYFESNMLTTYPPKSLCRLYLRVLKKSNVQIDANEVYKKSEDI